MLSKSKMLPFGLFLPDMWLTSCSENTTSCCYLCILSTMSLLSLCSRKFWSTHFKASWSFRA